MRAGDLDRKLVIEEPTGTRNGIGENIETWSEFATVWAKRLPVKANEYYATDQVNAPVEAVFRIRWLSGLTAAMRISYDGKYYDILSIQEIGRREGYELIARVHSG